MSPQQTSEWHDCRAAALDHVMEADKEFCLTCELSFLFRMLHDAKSSVCQVRSKDRSETHTCGLLV